MFGLPFAEPRESPVSCDFCFFGVPYEKGRTGLPGAAEAPDSLRAYSGNLPALVSTETGRNQGWLDYDLDRPLLRDALLMDAGNILSFPGEPPAKVFRRVTELLEAILQSDAIPVAIGGDHSITAPILRGFGKNRLKVVQFDAHTDLDNLIPGGVLHHGNVIRRALELPNVEQVFSLGLRGITPLPQNFQEWDSPRLSARQLRQGGVQAMLDLLGEPGPVYVTLDLDVLDPAYLPAVGTPAPGGLDPGLLKELLWSLGSSMEVVGFDIVELSPRDHGVTSLALATEMLLTLAGAIYGG